MSDLVTARLRTIIPAIVGAAIAWLSVRLGLAPDAIDVGALSAAAVAVAIAAWHIVATGLEQRWPALGWLLGRPGPATYPSTKIGEPVEAAPLLTVDEARDIIGPRDWSDTTIRAHARLDELVAEARAAEPSDGWPAHMTVLGRRRQP